MSIIQGNTKVSAGGYTIDQSIRFDKTASSRLQLTQGTPDGTSWTLSWWMKRGKIDASEMWFINGGNAYPDYIRFETSEKIRFRIFSRGIDNTTTAVFRDPSAWYHFVANWNGSTGAYNLWQNNVSLISGTGSSGETYYNKSGEFFSLGSQGGGGNYYDGYLSEIVKLDNIVADPTSFGEYNDDGVWIPVNVSGLTFGSNGFYITGENSADLGADYSGNGNDFTSSGLTSDDQVADSPTENYATLNPLDDATGYTTPLISNGNLDVDDRTGNAVRGNFGFKQGDGKYVYEVNITNLIGSMDLGWSAAGVDLWAVNGAEVMYEDDGNKLVSANSSSTPTRTSYGASYTSGDVIRVETDFTASTVEFFKNGTSQGSIDFSGMNDGTLYFPACYCNRVDAEFNFGQQPFIGTPTAGFVALSTANLPTPTIADGSTNFNIVLYTGTGNVTRSVTGVGFQPDLVLNKQRNNTSANVIANAVSGANTFMATEQSTAETSFTNSIYGYLSSFDSDGYTLTPGSTNNNYWNESGKNFVSYNWLAGNGTASNSDGDITSTVSVNTTAGFSVLTYSGSGTTNDTVGHGLGVKPSVVIVKPRNASDNWIVNDWSGDYTNKLKLNANEAASSAANFVNAADSTTFTLGSDINVNGSGRTFVAYCWNEVEGFSKFGVYTGNGSADGSFVYCGFRPSFVMIKCSSVANSWTVYDTTRQTYNPNGRYWLAESNAAEVASTTVEIDILSNGFKARDNQNNINGSGRTYIFMAFAEHPFGGDGVAPVPAR